MDLAWPMNMYCDVAKSGAADQSMTTGRLSDLHLVQTFLIPICQSQPQGRTHTAEKAIYLLMDPTSTFAA